MNNTMTKDQKKTAVTGDIAEMLKLIDAFGNLLKRETAALVAYDFKTVDALQSEKRTLAGKYQEQAQILSARRTDMAAVDLGLREKLLRARAQFTVLLNDNLRALERAKNSAGRLIERILDTARRAVINERHTHYSAKGHTGAYKSATSSLSVNETL